MARTRDAPALWRHAKRIEGVGRVTGTVCSWVEAVALRDELKEDCAVRRGAELERITEHAL